MDRGQQTFRFIETGLTQDENVEVLSNLTPGTVVVAKGASMLREGDIMKIVAGPGANGDKRGTRAEAEGTAPKETPARSSGGPTSTRSQAAKPTMQARSLSGEGAGSGQ